MPDQTRHDDSSLTRVKTGPPNLAHHLELRAWLDTATDGLCDVAKQRVEGEIRAHYAEAVADERASGLNKDDAHRVAMETLGDPKKAKKAFRQVHLTKNDAKQLAPIPDLALKNKAEWIVWIVLMVLAGGFWGLMAGNVTNGALFMCGVLLPTISDFAIVVPFLREKRWRRALAWRFTANLFGVICILSLTGCRDILLDWLNGEMSVTRLVRDYGAIFFGPGLVGVIAGLRLRGLLRKMRMKPVAEEIATMEHREGNA